MRQIVLDTETTGLDPKQGHRIIEVAGVEFVNRRPTGRHIHFYLNPEREIDSGATDVHGLTWEMLRDKAKFADVVNEFVEFAQGAEWIIDGMLAAETLAAVRVLMPSADELELHRSYLAELQRECRGVCLWITLTT